MNSGDHFDQVFYAEGRKALYHAVQAGSSERVNDAKIFIEDAIASGTPRTLFVVVPDTIRPSDLVSPPDSPETVEAPIGSRRCSVGTRLSMSASVSGEEIDAILV